MFRGEWRSATLRNAENNLRRTQTLLIPTFILNLSIVNPFSESLLRAYNHTSLCRFRWMKTGLFYTNLLFVGRVLIWPEEIEDIFIDRRSSVMLTLDSWHNPTILVPLIWFPISINVLGNQIFSRYSYLVPFDLRTLYLSKPSKRSFLNTDSGLAFVSDWKFKVRRFVVV